MSVLPIVVTNGRWDYLRRALASYWRDFQWEGVDREHAVLVYDSETGSVPDDVMGYFAYEVRTNSRGFDAACQRVLEVALRAPGRVTHVLHLEDDFVLERPVSVKRMVDALELVPDVAQVALLRQPVHPAEVAAGGVMKMWPSAFEEVLLTTGDHPWSISKHDLFFTTNPSVYRRALSCVPWPDAPGSEAKFTEKLRGLGFSFAYLGSPADEPLVHHIGDERTGSGY